MRPKPPSALKPSRTPRGTVEPEARRTADELLAASLRREQEALRQSEARLRLALDAARMMVWHWDLTTGLIAQSDNAGEILGLPAGTALASPEAWFALVHAEDLHRYRAAVDASITSKTSYTCLFRLGRLCDGATTWLEDRGGVTCDAAGNVNGIGGVILDVTEREKAQERSRFVIEVSRIVGSSMSVEEIAEQLTRKIVEGGLASFCWLDLVDAGDGLSFCASAHEDPEKEALSREMRRRYPLTLNHLQSRAIATGRPQLVPRVDDGLIHAMAHDRDNRQMLFALRMSTLMNVPLVARGRVLGALGIGGSHRPPFAEEDLAWATDLAVRAAIALDNAKLSQEREERVAALEESERAYRFLAESIPQIVWTTSADGHLDYVNQNYADYVGLTREQARAAPWRDFVHPDDIDAASRDWQISVGTGANLRNEQRIRGKDGAYRWYLLQARAMRDAQGAVIRWFGTATNINELKRAQAQMDALLEAAPIGIALFDTELRYLKINRALAEQNGSPIERHLGQRLRDLHPRLAPVIEPMFQRVLETGGPVLNLETSGRPTHRADALSYNLVNYYPVRVEGQVTGLATIVVDITEHQRSELRAHLRAKIGAALADLLDPAMMLKLFPLLLVPELADWCSIYLVADSGDIEIAALQHVDPAHDALLRRLQATFSSGAEMGAGPAYTIRTGNSTLLADITPEHLAGGTQDAEVSELFKALMPSSWMMVPLTSYGRTFGALGLGLTVGSSRYDAADLALAEDLGHRLAVALDNARLFETAQRDRLRAEEAGRAKDEFLAVVSHELRTPLTAMLGWTRMLRTGAVVPGRQAKALETIERNCMAQAQLIEDLLDTSSIITGKLRLNVGPVDLRQIVASAIETIRPAAEAKGVSLEQALDPIVDLVAGDADRLLQIVWNLLSNAVKFTPREGRVRISLTRDDSHVDIKVEDTGRGIVPGFLSHVFERFRQADVGTTRSHGGLGLGLSIVRHLVELHGGTVGAFSKGEGQGATFVARLPMVRVRSAPAPVSMAPSSSPQSREAFPRLPELAGLRVVIVDDDPDALYLLQTVLELCNVHVHAVATAEEALKLVQEVLPDVLLSDIGMPFEDGYLLLEKVRRLPADKGGRTPAVALTAYAGMEDRIKALLAGYHVHVAKPIDPAELLSILATVSGRHHG